MDFKTMRDMLRKAVLDRPADETPIYHLADELLFVRLPGGKVAIGHGDTVTIVEPHEWASAVASVSKSGEMGQTFDAALRFHMLDFPSSAAI